MLKILQSFLSQSGQNLGEKFAKSALSTLPKFRSAFLAVATVVMEWFPLYLNVEILDKNPTKSEFTFGCNTKSRKEETDGVNSNVNTAILSGALPCCFTHKMN